MTCEGLPKNRSLQLGPQSLDSFAAILRWILPFIVMLPTYSLKCLRTAYVGRCKWFISARLRASLATASSEGFVEIWSAAAIQLIHGASERQARQQRVRDPAVIAGRRQMAARPGLR